MKILFNTDVELILPTIKYSVFEIEQYMNNGTAATLVGNNGKHFVVNFSQVVAVEL